MCGFISDLAGPGEGVGLGAPLDAGEFVVELLGKGADLVVIDLIFLVAPGQLADGRDDGRRADAPGFLQRAAFRRLERSSTGTPQLFSSSMQDLRVTPRRIEPVSMGVTTVPLILNMTFMPPPSSTYLRSTPSSQRTCE